MPVIVRRSAVMATSLSLLLLIAAPAWAHVTVRAEDPAPGAFSKYTIRVPNERDDAGTTQVEVEVPDGFEFLSYQPKEGWDIEIGDGVVSISGGTIGPGQFDEFVFVGRNPEEPTDLTFPAVQTYEGGDEVRWVGEPDSDEPAPVVAIAGEAGGHGAAADEGGTETAAAGGGAAADDAAADDGGAAPALTWVALAAGVIGLLLAAAAFARAGRPAARG